MVVIDNKVAMLWSLAPLRGKSHSNRTALPTAVGIAARDRPCLCFNVWPCRLRLLCQPTRTLCTTTAFRRESLARL